MAALEQKKSRFRYRMKAAAFCAVCLVIALGLALLIAQTSVRISGTMAESLAASIFADHGALGYVVTALAAFCLGTLVTIFCFRLRRQEDSGEKNREESDDLHH